MRDYAIEIVPDLTDDIRNMKEEEVKEIFLAIMGELKKQKNQC